MDQPLATRRRRRVARLGLEYLVSGRFGSGPDDRGFHSVAWVFDGDLLDHVDAEEVKSAMQTYKNRMDKEFAALADACDADM